MKKLISFVLTCVLLLSACGNTNQEQDLTYAFRGEHEYFVISNGSIVLGDTEDVFEGGDLEVTQAGIFDEVASYSVTFYTLINGEQRTILSNHIVDQTGGSVNISGDLGKVSGGSFITGNKVTTMDDLKESLWFELKTTDLSGEVNVYQIQLTFTE